MNGQTNSEAKDSGAIRAAVSVEQRSAEVAGDAFDSEEFYGLMQAYRHAPVASQSTVIAAFEAVKEFSRRALAKVGA